MQGYSVVISHDPADGACLALGDPPMAVVADLWMPSISGVQLCRLLKAEPATEHVPVILRGPDGPRNRFWAERAGASAYVVKGRMGDLVRALGTAIESSSGASSFFTELAPGENSVRERIAAHLDAALFESVLAAEVRALGTCGAFDRLFDLFSQFVSRVATYRWLAVSTTQPARLGLHTNPGQRQRAEAEARQALGIGSDALTIAVEDEDAFPDEEGPPPIIRPISLGGIAIGQLALATRHPEHTQDVDFAAVIARELAGPIRMATLVEESQRLATMDALTSLMNRRAFMNSLDVEMSRASRYAQPLSFLLLDIDHFKAINDSRGHQGGDVVLAAVGRLLSAQARKSDLVARWGGEEFVLALTTTDIAGGAVVGERVRRAVEELDILDADGSRIPVTASVEMLVDRADRAMYSAKMGGRNRLEVAPTKEAATPPPSQSKENAA
jgi:two-component system cell cycle response regulator